jgi:tetratricopeptide (TPR) repeat protein
VFNAETAGNYQIVAKSFDGTGGNFALEVRPATPYEVALNDAQVSLQAGDFDAAIAAYGEAIALEPENPEPYIARAESYIGKTQVELESQGRFLESPDDLPADAKSAIVADFEQAAQLYQEAGDAFTAQSLREQIEYIQTGEIPGPNGGGPRPEGAEPM